MDKHLEFVLAAEDAVTTTKAVSLMQGDHPGWPGTDGKTKGAGPYQGLFWVLRAGEAIGEADNFVARLQHSDTEDGTYTDLLVLPAVAEDKSQGETIAMMPVPMQARNWLRCEFSEAKKVDSFLTDAVDKHYPGVWDGSDN